ncbi:MAG: threonine synthase [Ktedonobacteraceae bacterium]
MFATHLRCLRCGTTAPLDPRAYLCPSCGPGNATFDPGTYDVQYDYEAAAESFIAQTKRPRAYHDIFRFLPLLPVAEPGQVLPAGGTPLVSAPRLAGRFGLKALYLKDETRNPTRCLKDRATAIALTIAQSEGYQDLYCASAGNAAISLAGFCAQQGLTCHAFVPHHASATRLEWLQRYGAHVHISEGNYDQAFAEAELAGQENDWYSRNCAYNPYLVEGKKTAAFEIAEQLEWRAPDLVVAPVGDGCTLGALGKGFRELISIGLTTQLPRLLGIQSERVQPVVQRYYGEPVDPEEHETEAASIAVHHPRNFLRLRAELDASSGSMLAVSDEEMHIAQSILSCEAGVVAELTSATTFAGLIRLSSIKNLQGQTAVLVITGGRPDD